MSKLSGMLLAIVIVSIAIVTIGKQSEACQRVSPVVVSQTCTIAEYIVRATAIEYSRPPENPNMLTTGPTDSKVRFEVEEILKGDILPSSIELNGYLNDKDEFNGHPVPYDYVRKSGLRGSCYANTYKQGAQFLLFIGKSGKGFTVEIDPLAPVNEQLHSESDPWVYYIKGLLKGLEEPGKYEKKSKQ